MTLIEKVHPLKHLWLYIFSGLTGTFAVIDFSTWVTRQSSRLRLIERVEGLGGISDENLQNAANCYYCCH